MGQPQYYVSGVNWQWFDEAKDVASTLERKYFCLYLKMVV
ncbi:hypothetical protein J832_4120 [Acinetobacter baumannii 25691_9]|nr:hypothetical protein J832_4120 [Acinetobacter baumannii 25691_9]